MSGAGLKQLRFAPAGQHHPVPVGQHEPGDRPADPRTGAGDYRYSAGKMLSCHPASVCRDPASGQCYAYISAACQPATGGRSADGPSPGGPSPVRRD